MKIQRLIFSLFIVGLLSMTACNNEEEIAPNTITANDFSASIDENAQKGDAIGKFTANTSRGAVTYSITSQSVANAITIDANTGNMTVEDSSAFDYETNQSITGKIKISNEDNLESEVNFTIAINDLPTEINVFLEDEEISEGSTVNFGITSSSIFKTFTIENAGQDDLILSEDPIIGIAGAEFTISEQPTTNILKTGERTTFQVRFDPNSSVTSSGATIDILNNDNDEGNYTIYVKGRYGIVILGI